MNPVSPIVTVSPLEGLVETMIEPVPLEPSCRTVTVPAAADASRTWISEEKVSLVRSSRFPVSALVSEVLTAETSPTVETFIVSDALEERTINF